MTRLRRTIAPRGGRPLDLPRAFTLLGKAPSRADLGWVIDRLRESGVEEVEFDDSLVEVAEAAGSSAFVALDLVPPSTSVSSCGRRDRGPVR